jgi:hypothetical protein
VMKQERLKHNNTKGIFSGSVARRIGRRASKMERRSVVTAGRKARRKDKKCGAWGGSRGINLMLRPASQELRKGDPLVQLGPT